MKSFSILSVCLLAVIFANNQALGSITLDIGDHTSGGYSASSIHGVGNSATDQMSGPVSSGLFGSLVGDFTDYTSGNVFGITGGSMSGTVGGALSGNGSDSLNIMFTGGELKFYNGGTVGGWVDYTIQQAGSNLTGGAGTFFFANTNYGFNNNSPGPNSWLGSVAGGDLALSLWGNNWATSSHNWGFLGDEGFTYGVTSPPDRASLLNTNTIALGSDIYARIGSQVPEPMSLIVWGALFAFLGPIRSRRRTLAA